MYLLMWQVLLRPLKYEMRVWVCLQRIHSQLERDEGTRL